MAMSDYYQCHVCSGKTFYDADLHYDHAINGVHPVGVGDMKVLCLECAKKFKVVVAEILAQSQTPADAAQEKYDPPMQQISQQFVDGPDEPAGAGKETK
ncbi:MAG: hypothetical protein WC455_18170 [Dehalococcoidia bacterium]|jgi:hypothetical protein